MHYVFVENNFCQLISKVISSGSSLNLLLAIWATSGTSFSLIMKF